MENQSLKLRQIKAPVFSTEFPKKSKKGCSKSTSLAKKVSIQLILETILVLKKVRNKQQLLILPKANYTQKKFY